MEGNKMSAKASGKDFLVTVLNLSGQFMTQYHLLMENVGGNQYDYIPYTS
jgi:hypothetical protein